MKNAIILICLLMFVGCRTITKVQTEYVTKDSIINHTQHLRDSIYLHDSVTIRQKNDTIYIAQTRTIYKEKTNAVTDTIYIDKTDTAIETRTMTKKVVPWWCWLILCIAFVGLSLKLCNFVLVK